MLKEPQAQETLDTLRHLLLEQAEAEQQRLAQELGVLRSELEEDEKLQARLSPHFERHVQFLQDNFPALFRKNLLDTIRRQVTESRDEIIEALYPIIGRMIARYLKSEFEKLNQTLEDAQSRLFSLHYWKLRLRAWVTGVSYRQLLLLETRQPQLREVFVVDNQSGLLLGHFSATELMDPDMIAGMLTGIRGFVEHAFLKGQQRLEVLEYESYKIVVNDFQSFYFASVIDGPINAAYKSRLDSHILEFLEKHPIALHHNVSADSQARLAAQLNEHFHGFDQLDQ